MSLAAPAWLLLGGLGLLVLLLHTRRRRTLEVSSVRIWRLLEAAAPPRRVIKPPKASLLLALQLAAVLLVALALAEPLLAGAARRGEHLVFVLDSSGSMRATDVPPSRFQSALAYLRQAAGGPRGGRLSLLSAASQPRVEAARLRRPDELLGALERLSASDGPADWQRVGELISGLRREGELLRVVILSDAAGQDPTGVLRAALPGAEIELVRFGGTVPNAGIAGLTATPVDLASGRWRLKGRVRSFGADAPLTLTALFEPAGSEGFLAWAETTVVPEEGEASFEFDLELPPAGVLEVRLPGDASSHDNHAYLLLDSAPRSFEVLHVGPDDPPLLKALQAVPQVEVFQASALPAASDGFDLVIIDGAAVPHHPGTNTLWLGGGRLAAEEVASLADPGPSGWRTTHPLSSSVGWGNLSVNQAFLRRRLPGAEVLLQAPGAPLVQARTTVYGREVVVAFPLDQSNWAERAGFPIFIANLVHWIGPQLGQAARSCQVGRPCSLDPRLLSGGLRLVTPTGAATVLPSPFVADADGGAAWSAPGFAGSFVPRRAGLYRLEGDGFSEPVAVNAFFPQESDLSPKGTRLGGTAPEAPRRTPVPWRWLLLAVLALLLLEGWLAGRGQERFLRRAALGRGSPLAGRRRLVLVLRLLAVACLVLALARAPWFAPLRQRLVVVAEGGWPGGGLEPALAAAETGAGPLRDVSIIAVGAPSRLVSAEAAAKRPGPSADLEAALTLAAGFFANGERGRILLVGSGAETRGQVQRAVPLLQQEAVPIDVQPLEGLPPGEVLVERVATPALLYAGGSSFLHGTIYSHRAVPAAIRVLREGKVVAEQEVELHPGRNRLETAISEPEPGAFLYEVEVQAEGDVISENNRDGSLIRVAPGPSVLLLAAQANWGDTLAGALAAQGVRAEVSPPRMAPRTLEQWLAYDATILMNVPALELTSKQQELLETAVHRHGRGLLLLGGENSFGPGGYYQTALERLSPLSSRIPRDVPKVALMLVLDRSGSMQQQVGRATRLDITKQAAISAIGLLPAASLAGIVVFDSEARVLVPMQPAAEQEALRVALEPLKPGGGTSIYPGLVEAYRQMQAVEASTRHIVVMSDGLSQPGDFEEILRRLAAEDITVSTISVGEVADTSLLEQIAEEGRGVFHATEDFRALPSILSQEALLLSSSPVKQRTVVPRWVEGRSPFLDGLPQSLPPLHGYVLTTKKPDADLHLALAGEGGELVPVLASWRYGAGQVVAFASQAAGAWTQEWLAMPEYPLFWSQLLRHVLPQTPGPGLHLELSRYGDEVHVRLQALDPLGEPQEDAGAAAAFAPPGAEEPIPLELRRSRTGLYEGSFLAGRPGAYRVSVRAGPESSEAELYVGYPARYKPIGLGPDRLRQIAHATGGQELLGDPPPAVRGWPWAPRRAWRPWALFGLGLFLLELVARYAPGLLGLKSGPNRARAA